MTVPEITEPSLPEPLFSVVSGTPDAEELAALTVVLGALLAAPRTEVVRQDEVVALVGRRSRYLAPGSWRTGDQLPGGTRFAA